MKITCKRSNDAANSAVLNKRYCIDGDDSELSDEEVIPVGAMCLRKVEGGSIKIVILR